MTADGNHARVDGFVSLAVVASAVVVARRSARRSSRTRTSPPLTTSFHKRAPASTI
jgi:hypothetical protein